MNDILSEYKLKWIHYLYLKMKLAESILQHMSVQVPVHKNFILHFS